ncbi:nucleic-acid-binding protein from mobile element jockey [Plakobranchus ocellatus]|uniref:Nucleic-acid-binding protein from mobile element jockey n=1 Tax=Plakobranchus ocellatus TaxID=259542 RepID=A0AAV4C2A3_9GAST|nr:nucleic-acid-binding protein from mobile element jockey [Plakobranchus ocellatus]
MLWHGKDRCKKPAAVCIRCDKGGHVERDCLADPHCVNCRGDHAASSKTCPKSLEEQAILRYKAENGGTFQQAPTMEAGPSGTQPAKRFWAQNAIEMLENNEELPSVLSEESNDSDYSLSSSDSHSDFDARSRSRPVIRSMAFGEIPSASNRKGKEGVSRA